MESIDTLMARKRYALRNLSWFAPWTGSTTSRRCPAKAGIEETAGLFQRKGKEWLTRRAIAAAQVGWIGGPPAVIGKRRNEALIWRFGGKSAACRRRSWIGFAIAGLALLAVLGWVVMLLWNWLMPDIFGLPSVSYWQAWGLLVLFWILFKSWSFKDSDHSSNRRRRNTCGATCRKTRCPMGIGREFSRGSNGPRCGSLPCWGPGHVIGPVWESCSMDDGLGSLSVEATGETRPSRPFGMTEKVQIAAASVRVEPTRRVYRRPWDGNG